MRKLIYITIISFITIIVGMLIFLITTGIKTDNFNSLINEKVNEIDPKIKLKLNEVNFKLNPSNFEFEISTLDPQIAINEKNIENSKSDIGWGHQIRSYVLHPYKMVKDNRTNFESSSPEKVLDGEIDNFLENSLYKSNA